MNIIEKLLGKDNGYDNGNHGLVGGDGTEDLFVDVPLDTSWIWRNRA